MSLTFRPVIRLCRASRTIRPLRSIATSTSRTSRTVSSPALPVSLSSFTLTVWQQPSGSARMSSSKASIVDWVKTNSKTGEFKRQVSSFRNQISVDGQYPPESGRYHLYVSLACPWAHRTLIMLRLKGLDQHIPITVVHWHLGEGGWRFATKEEEDVSTRMVPAEQSHLKSGEPLTHLLQLYQQSNPDYDARATVPVLFDTKTSMIVNNESAEIVRIFNSQFNSILPPEYAEINVVPDDLVAEIDRANELIYTDINNGVYRSGFATTQAAYEAAVKEVFDALDTLEARLEKLELAQPVGAPGPFFFGDNFTETDVRLYPSLVRFDAVYVQHFKCNIRDIRSGYPAIHRWLRRLYWLGVKVDGVSADVTANVFQQTTDFDHIKYHYTKSHKQINPFSITPVGPLPNMLPLDADHAKARPGKP